MLKLLRKKEFANGVVYAFETEDGYKVETTDTFLPYYTQDSLRRKTNQLNDTNLGNRAERWLIGVSVMSGCPVHCKFCATGQMKKWRNLTTAEIVQQVEYVVNSRPENFTDAMEHKINYTRMGEPFLNLENVINAINILDGWYYGTHHYVSTIGIAGSDFSWIRENVTLQISLHSLDDDKRDWLIPYKNKMSISELGQVRTNSRRKTTLNMTLVDESDFDIEKIKTNFDKEKFFIKLSPINTNTISDKNKLGKGCIKYNNKR
ncbi:MAG: radical SAM protein [Candidatus Pacebacteria bacterium]|nr:radical SAM protein [Candidatus Paceibacterota bacterium]